MKIFFATVSPSLSLSCEEKYQEKPLGTGDELLKQHKLGSVFFISFETDALMMK